MPNIEMDLSAEEIEVVREALSFYRVLNNWSRYARHSTDEEREKAVEKIGYIDHIEWVLKQAAP